MSKSLDTCTDGHSLIVGRGLSPKSPERGWTELTHGRRLTAERNRPGQSGLLFLQAVLSQWAAGAALLSQGGLGLGVRLGCRGPGRGGRAHGQDALATAGRRGHAHNHGGRGVGDLKYSGVLLLGSPWHLKFNHLMSLMIVRWERRRQMAPAIKIFFMTWLVT